MKAMLLVSAYVPSHVHEWGFRVTKEVFLVQVSDRWIFVEREFVYDNRGTHMGETQECLTIIQDQKRISFLYWKYLGECEVDTRTIRALLKSTSKSIIRSGSEHYGHPIVGEPWQEHRDGHCCEVLLPAA